jgi:hypothetical protein
MEGWFLCFTTPHQLQPLFNVNYIREEVFVASGRGIFEGTIPACTWSDRGKQRKASITAFAVPAQIRPGHLPNANQERHTLIQLARLLASV